MEACFHGLSSGLDPLSCYVGKPLLISSPQKIDIVDFPPVSKDSSVGIFLINTGTTSKTGKLVLLFNEKLNSEKFRNILNTQIIPRNNNCIQAILEGKIRNFHDEMRLFSALQLEYFAEMIPDEFREIWSNGINTRDYSLKLCGSGGGGYLLGFTGDIKGVEEYFYKQGTELITV